jgi:hypothetical protein
LVDRGREVGLFALDAFDDRVAVAIDHHVEDERPATHGTVLHEVLAPPRGRIDADRVLFVARWAGIEGVWFNRHAMAFVRTR